MPWAHNISSYFQDQGMEPADINKLLSSFGVKDPPLAAPKQEGPDVGKAQKEVYRLAKELKEQEAKAQRLYDEALAAQGQCETLQSQLLEARKVAQQIAADAMQNLSGPEPQI